MSTVREPQRSDIVSMSSVHFTYPARKGTPTFSINVPDFTLASGGRCMLMGESGSGKSTILNLVAGELVANQGTVTVLGQDLNRLDEAERQAFRIANIGYIFQSFPLVPYLTALQNVILPYRINPHLTLGTEVTNHAHELLDGLGLQQKSSRKPHELSQGERQRVAIARALITKPQLILADEPTAGLDIARSHAVMDVLDNIVQESGVGLLVVSHEPQIVERFEQVVRLEGSL